MKYECVSEERRKIKKYFIQGKKVQRHGADKGKALLDSQQSLVWLEQSVGNERSSLVGGLPILFLSLCFLLQGGTKGFYRQEQPGLSERQGYFID